jgi:hypothetical protein
LWLAWEGIQNKTPANPAFLLAILADDLNTVWCDSYAFHGNYWFICSKAQAIEHFLTTNRPRNGILGNWFGSVSAHKKEEASIGIAAAAFIHFQGLRRTLHVIARS